MLHTGWKILGNLKLGRAKSYLQIAAHFWEQTSFIRCSP